MVASQMTFAGASLPKSNSASTRLARGVFVSCVVGSAAHALPRATNNITSPAIPTFVRVPISQPPKARFGGRD